MIPGPMGNRCGRREALRGSGDLLHTCTCTCTCLLHPPASPD